jgi:hypothetical protein
MLAEIMAAHADRMVRGEGNDMEYLTLFPDHREELAPLLDVARQVKDTLVQVRPSVTFRERLRQDLMIAAQQRFDSPLRLERSRWRRPWVIGAAAVGSVISLASAVGVIVYRRRARAAEPATVSG